MWCILIENSLSSILSIIAFFPSGLLVASMICWLRKFPILPRGKQQGEILEAITESEIWNLKPFIFSDFSLKSRKLKRSWMKSLEIRDLEISMKSWDPNEILKSKWNPEILKSWRTFYSVADPAHLAVDNYPSDRVLAFSSMVLQRDRMVRKRVDAHCLLEWHISLWQEDWFAFSRGCSLQFRSSPVDTAWCCCPCF